MGRFCGKEGGSHQRTESADDFEQDYRPWPENDEYVKVSTIRIMLVVIFVLQYLLSWSCCHVFSVLKVLQFS